MEKTIAAATAERKEAVAQQMKWLLSPETRRLRAFAQELWRAAASPTATTMTDAATSAARINWSTCWAWCAACDSPRTVAVDTYTTHSVA